MRSPDFSSRPRPPRPRALDLLLVALAALLLLVSVHGSWTAWRNARRADDALVRVREEIHEAQAAGRVLAARGGRLSEGDLPTQALLTALAPPPRLLADLAALLPGDVRLEAVELSYGERLRVELRVASRRAVAYDLFLDRLSGSPAFVDVVPGAESGGDELRASVSAVYRTQATP